MANTETKPLDTGLRGVRSPERSNPDANRVGCMKRKDAVRRDAFEGSPKGSGYRPSGDNEAEDLRYRS